MKNYLSTCDQYHTTTLKMNLSEEEWKPRARKNLEIKDYLPRNFPNRIVVQNIVRFYPLTFCDEELKCCRRVLSKNNHLQIKWTEKLASLINGKKGCNKNDSNQINKSDIWFYPLTLGSPWEQCVAKKCLQCIQCCQCLLLKMYLQ